ncbi:MAG TPA: C_GCAxxG_C_C family protein [Gammaproteobacteria bacterium]|nr:C_GCAxxG_C_C family protein [Gammaproteobacteria bacterium]
MAKQDQPDTTDKARLAEDAYDKAFDYELNYGCCPQCVLTAVKETVGIVSDDTIKASHGLSGGGALSGQGVCGALSGGLVALGAKRGRDADKLDRGRGMANFQAGRQLVERFREEFGGLTCEELQVRFAGRTYDMWNREEYAAFGRERGDKCARASALVAKWVVEML